jgi:hypothetical protein
MQMQMFIMLWLYCEQQRTFIYFRHILFYICRHFLNENFLRQTSSYLKFVGKVNIELEVQRSFYNEYSLKS